MGEGVGVEAKKGEWRASKPYRVGVYRVREGGGSEENKGREWGTMGRVYGKQKSLRKE